MPSAEGIRRLSPHPEAISAKEGYQTAPDKRRRRWSQSQPSVGQAEEGRAMGGRVRDSGRGSRNEFQNGKRRPALESAENHASAR